MGILKSLLGFVWSSKDEKYKRADKPVEVDAAGNKRDFSLVFDDKGQRVSVGLPGEDRFAKPPRDPYAQMAKDGPNSESFYRGLYESDLFGDHEKRK